MPESRRDRASRYSNPVSVIFTAFAVLISTGTVLLSLPIATETREPSHLTDALFTATSAGTVTGLTVVDTGGHWSTFGEIVIMLLMQVGGLGIMTFATLFALVMTRRLGLRARMIAQAETQALQARDVRRVVRNVVLFSLSTEAVVAIILALRFGTTYSYDVARAVYHAVFHAIATFNNAGFSLNADSLMGFSSDPVVLLPIALLGIVGGLGFPVVFELLRAWRRPRTWSVLARVTIGVSSALLLIGTIAFTTIEWANPQTMGPMSVPEKLLNGFFQSMTTRSLGFNTISTPEMEHESWLICDIFMFIGGGSAGTAGGIKVTTFGLLAFVIWAELRGEARVNVGHRRLSETTQRQALTIALLAVGIVVLGTVTILSLTDASLDAVLFDVISGALTVGLSTGVVGELGPAGKLVMTVLMYLGRVAPVVLGTTLALRERGRRRYELPEERPIVG